MQMVNGGESVEGVVWAIYEKKEIAADVELEEPKEARKNLE